MNEFEWMNEEYQYELTRDERWDILHMRATGTLVPWDRMAIPHHEWMDEVTTLDTYSHDFELNKGKTIYVPRFREELTKKEIDFLNKKRSMRIKESFVGNTIGEMNKYP
jgi:hypothetical protein